MRMLIKVRPPLYNFTALLSELLPSAMLATGVVPEVMDWGQCRMHVVLSFMIPPEFYHVAVVVGFVGVTFCYALGAEPFSEWADDDENGNQALE
ncbi:hypothetical protein B0H11DRAFT_2280656 [Mycena galericulata]|nr:hypothetical protein B0H11DRAFT_2280656 [Mycena galericulata]